MTEKTGPMTSFEDGSFEGGRGERREERFVRHMDPMRQRQSEPDMSFSRDNVTCVDYQGPNCQGDEARSAPNAESASLRPRAGATVSLGSSGFTRADNVNSTIAGRGSEFDDFDDGVYYEPEAVDFIDANGVYFSIDFARELGRGGEAVVVVATDASGVEYAAKVYDIPTNAREARNHRIVLEFLFNQTQESSEGYRITHLMPLISYGTVSAQRLGEPHTRKVNVSILPKCQCLGDHIVAVEDLKGRIIPGIAEALKVLHAQNIVHRDVKPSNIYEYNGVVVLGDYGISTVLDSSTNLKDTHSNRGTWGYWLPVGYVEPRGDWYSLGYTIWTIYNENIHPHQARIDSGNLAEVHAGKRIVPFVPKSEADSSLKDLVYGLTMTVPSQRLGYTDIQRWLESPQDFSFIDPNEEESSTWKRSYNFGDKRYKDASSLAEALSSDWNRAIEHLFDGENLVTHFSQVGENEISTRLHVIVREDAGAKKNLGVAKAIYYISGEDERRCWKGLDASITGLTAAFSAKDVDKLSEYDELFKSGFVSWSIEQSQDELLQATLESIKTIETTSQKQPFIARLLFQHLFAGGGTSDYAGYKTAEELSRHIFDSPQSFYSLLKDKQSAQKMLCAFAPFFASEGRLPALITAASGLKDDPLENSKIVLVVLDGLDGGNLFARQFAASCGPNSDSLWVAGHAELYTVVEGEKSSEARAALSSLKQIQVSQVDSVEVIAKKGSEARVNADRVRDMMERNPLAGYLGVKTSQAIAAANDDAYFCAEFFGREVPRGFVRDMLLRSPSASGWNEVQLFSSKSVSSEMGFATMANSEIQAGLAVCEKARKKGGSRAAAITRMSIDAILILLFLIVVTAFAATLNASTALSLSALGVKSPQTLAPAFNQITLSIAFFFFVFDGVIAFFSTRSSSILASITKRLRDCETAVSNAVESFNDASHPYVQTLRNPSIVEAHTTTQLSDLIESETNRAYSVTSPTSGATYKTVWHVTAIIGFVFVALAFFPVASMLIPFDPKPLLLLLLVVSMVLYGLVVLGSHFIGIDYYKNHWWVLAVMATSPIALLAIVAVAALVYGLLYLVGLIIGTLLGIVGIVAAIGIAIALFSS